jgi:hypothetical protein
MVTLPLMRPSHRSLRCCHSRARCADDAGFAAHIYKVQALVGCGDGQIHTPALGSWAVPENSSINSSGAVVQVLTPDTMSDGELAMLQGGPMVRRALLVCTAVGAIGNHALHGGTCCRTDLADAQGLEPEHLLGLC